MIRNASLFLILLASFFSQAQTNSRQLDWQNMREGEDVEYCITHKKLEESLKNPAFKEAYLKEQSAFEALMKQGGAEQTKSTVYTIPVVFHVLHYGGDENISREQILDALRILNRDFAMENEDTATIQLPFKNLKSKADIRFVLATKAPNGQCFSGITRTLSVKTNDGENGSAQVNAIVNGNDVYQGVWPGNKYLNIFVCKNIGGAAGYTNYPSSWSASSMTNGIWVLHNYVGSIGTSGPGTSRTLTHEVGHWLNLPHLWGSTNNPGVSCGNDFVDDTPQCIGSTTCIPKNTCSGDNAYWGFDQIDNIENYMEYSYCSKMFTIGQVERMRTAIVQANTGRANIISAANLAAVGADEEPTLCKADFHVNTRVVCVNEPVQFWDDSYQVATGWEWNFAGGTPATSTEQNPVVSYSAPGTYAVSLTASDGTDSHTLDRTAYITVLPPASELPFYESFEGLSSLEYPDWINQGLSPTVSWSLTSSAGYASSKSIFINNMNQQLGEKNVLITKAFDLSDAPVNEGVVLTFKYAYRKRISNNYDILRIYSSSDCGETWVMRKALTAATMTQGILEPSFFVPSQDDWRTYHVSNIPVSAWSPHVQFKFEFINGGGNNIYLDDINIYSGSPSESPVLGLEDLEQVPVITLFPNPAQELVTILGNFNPLGREVAFRLLDVTGKVVLEMHSMDDELNAGIELNIASLSKGSYMLVYDTGIGSGVIPFIKR